MINGGGGTIAAANNCPAPSNPTYRDNWDEFVADMGDYLSPGLAAIDGQGHKHCMVYVLGKHPRCNKYPDSAYNIIYTTYNTTYGEGGDIDYWTDGVGDTRHCLYPL